MSEIDENMLHHTYSKPSGESCRIDDASSNNRRELLISALEEIAGALNGGDATEKQVESTLRALSKKLADPTRRLAKKRAACVLPCSEITRQRVMAKVDRNRVLRKSAKWGYGMSLR